MSSCFLLSNNSSLIRFPAVTSLAVSVSTLLITQTTQATSRTPQVSISAAKYQRAGIPETRRLLQSVLQPQSRRSAQLPLRAAQQYSAPSFPLSASSHNPHYRVTRRTQCSNGPRRRCHRSLPRQKPETSTSINDIRSSNICIALSHAIPAVAVLQC